MSGLTAHLLSECDSSADFVQCYRCFEAIHSKLYEQHTLENSCPGMFTVITMNVLCLTVVISSSYSSCRWLFIFIMFMSNCVILTSIIRTNNTFRFQFYFNRVQKSCFFCSLVLDCTTKMIEVMCVTQTLWITSFHNNQQITNSDLSDMKWTQASLPVHDVEAWGLDVWLRWHFLHLWPLSQAHCHSRLTS